VSDIKPGKGDCDCTFICDFCRTDYSANQERQVSVMIGHDQTFDFGLFCSRFCAIHALTASISRDLADGAAPRVWRASDLVLPDGEREKAKA
jgi:hypothetical protein